MARPCAIARTASIPFTLQLGDPSVIAERCGIDVVADFRRADVAAGGQGAPLLPAMHAMLLADPDHTRVVLNLGGIANVTVLAPTAACWASIPARPTACSMPGASAIAANRMIATVRSPPRASVDAALLQALLADPYFALPPPKSTGREHFHLAWLATHAPLAAICRRPTCRPPCWS